MIVHQNIFKLKDPGGYECYLERFHSNLYALRIRGQRLASAPATEVTAFELLFTTVIYFEGPTTWTGANVCLGSASEILAMLYHSCMLNRNADPEDIEEALDTYALFLILGTAGCTIKILASNEDYTVNIIN
jgi:hypothetical protein